VVSKYPEKFDRLIICSPLYTSPLKDQVFNVSFIRLFILAISYINCLISKRKNNNKYIDLNLLPPKTGKLFFNGLNKMKPDDIFNISDVVYSNTFDISNDLKYITNRTLIIGGTKDFLVNKKMLCKVKSFLNNSILKMHKGNHVTLYYNQEIWEDVINFAKGKL
jgi:hypothetical protein